MILPGPWPAPDGAAPPECRRRGLAWPLDPPNPREPAMLGHDHALSGALAFVAVAPLLPVSGTQL
ncbi:MAG TPA: hypothetical protein VGL33_10335, partial [Streptosporangiaceae bacterium]